MNNLDDNTPPFYRGHEGFQKVLKDNNLSRVGRCIRVYNYAGPSGNEKLYVLGTDKQLFDAQTREKVNPEDVFSREAAPNGWSVEGLQLMLLPEEEIKKLVKLGMI